MTSWMKKFTKGCLITALIMFCAGCVMCGAGRLLGGFARLEDMDLWNLRFPYTLVNGINVRLDLLGGRDRSETDGREWKPVGGAAGGTVSVAADALQRLEIDVDACRLHICKSEDRTIRILADDSGNRVRYCVEEGTLAVRTRRSWRSDLFSDETDEVYLYLPEDAVFDYMDIWVGSGTFESVPLRAGDIDIELGAGTGRFDGLCADSFLSMEVGAGSLRIGQLSCPDADLSIGAGEVLIEEASVTGDVDMDLGMGKMTLSGTVERNLAIDCGMGTVTMNLWDAEKDHDYVIDCSMGTVSVGGSNYSGLAREQKIDNGSGSTYDIDCAMGTVTLLFEQ